MNYLGFSKSNTFNGDVLMEDNLTVQGDLEVQGSFDIAGPIVISGDLTIDPPNCINTNCIEAIGNANFGIKSSSGVSQYKMLGGNDGALIDTKLACTKIVSSSNYPTQDDAEIRFQGSAGSGEIDFYTSQSPAAVAKIARLSSDGHGMQCDDFSSLSFTATNNPSLSFDNASGNGFINLNSGGSSAIAIDQNANTRINAAKTLSVNRIIEIDAATFNIKSSAGNEVFSINNFEQATFNQGSSAFSLPLDRGTPGQILSSNGLGSTSWIAQAVNNGIGVQQSSWVPTITSNRGGTFSVAGTTFRAIKIGVIVFFSGTFSNVVAFTGTGVTTVLTFTIDPSLGSIDVGTGIRNATCSINAYCANMQSSTLAQTSNFQYEGITVTGGGNSIEFSLRALDGGASAFISSSLTVGITGYYQSTTQASTLVGDVFQQVSGVISPFDPTATELQVPALISRPSTNSINISAPTQLRLDSKRMVGGTTNTVSVDHSGIFSGRDHTISASAQGSVICGGVLNQHFPASTLSSILGGTQNDTNGIQATILGGSTNACNGLRSMVHGFTNANSGNDCVVFGSNNSMGAGVNKSTILSGFSNSIANAGTDNCAIVGGTINNISSSNPNSVILGGVTGQIIGASSQTVILGGDSNSASFANNCSISGISNTLSECEACSIVGGNTNQFVNGCNNSTINAGSSNSFNASSECGIMAGANNTIQFSTNSTVIGGSGHLIDGTTRGTIIGGASNTLQTVTTGAIIGTGSIVTGVSNGYVLGGSACTVDGAGTIAMGTGVNAGGFTNCLIWSDGSSPATPTANNQLSMVASGGVILEAGGLTATSSSGMTMNVSGGTSTFNLEQVDIISTILEITTAGTPHLLLDGGSEITTLSGVETNIQGNNIASLKEINDNIELKLDSSGAILTGSDLSIATIGKGLKIAEGTDAKMGIATFVAGEVVVSTTAVTDNSRIFLSIQVPGGVVGSPWIRARNAGTDFQINSTSSLDTSDVAWMIVEPS